MIFAAPQALIKFIYCFIMSRFFLRILLVLTLFPLSFSNATYALDASDYTVEDVATDATAKSPSAARISAVTSARRDAFLILLGRLDLNVNTADNITDEEIFEMVRSEQIDNEKIAGNHYSAKLRIIFSKDFVEHILAQKKDQKKTIVSAVDAAKQKAKEEAGVDEIDVIIPAKIVNKKAVMWQEASDWQKALEKNIVKKIPANKAFLAIVKI